MIEVPLYTGINMVANIPAAPGRIKAYRGTLLIRNSPPSLGPPEVPRHRTTVES